MNRRTMPLVAVLLLLLPGITFASLELRLSGGWPIPSGEFKSKTSWPLTERLNNEVGLSTAGKWSLRAGLCYGFAELPINLVATCGIAYFDDEQWEVQETTVADPTGTGRYTDFQHRITPLTLGIEYAVGSAERTSSAIGVALGYYHYAFVNRGEYKPPVEFADNQGFIGWSLSLTQSARILERIWLFANLDYHSIELGDDTAIGIFEEGFVNRISFYRIELGILVEVID